MYYINLVLFLAHVGVIVGHSWMTCPPSFNNGFIQRGGIQGALCETERSNSPTTYVEAGDRLKVGWTSNNHAGGWVRISLVPHGQHLDEEKLKANVMKIACYGHDTRPGKTTGGDCKHPCNGRPGCEYQSNIYDIDRFDTTIMIPTNLPTGIYVLQVTMMVGNSHQPYNSCGKLHITGGNPNFKCVSNEEILVYPCLKSGGPRPEASLLPGAKRGNFCYGLDGSIGSVDDHLTQVPINVECDPRLSCLNSVASTECAAEPKMQEIQNAAGPYPRLPGCEVYNTLPELEPTCDDGKMNGNEDGIDCGGIMCAACPTDPTEVFAGEYYSKVEQVSSLWHESGQITVRVELVRNIESTQCWHLSLQFPNSIIVTNNPWGEGKLVEVKEENRILIFEKKVFRSWSAGDKVYVTFPIARNGLSGEEWNNEKMKFITALFEVYDDGTKCSSPQIQPWLA